MAKVNNIGVQEINCGFYLLDETIGAYKARMILSYLYILISV